MRFATIRDACELVNNMGSHFKTDLIRMNECTKSMSYLLSDLQRFFKPTDDTRYYSLPIIKYDKISFISMIICDLLRTQNKQIFKLTMNVVDPDQFIWILSGVCFHVKVPNDPVDATYLLNRDIKMKIRQDANFMKHIVVNSFWCHDKFAKTHWHDLLQFILESISEFDVTSYENRIVLEHVIKEFARSLLNFTPILFNEKWKYKWPCRNNSCRIISQQCLEQLQLYYKIIPAEIILIRNMVHPFLFTNSNNEINKYIETLHKNNYNVASELPIRAGYANRILDQSKNRIYILVGYNPKKLIVYECSWSGKKR